MNLLIIGGSSIGKKILPTMRSIPDLKVVGFASESAERGQRWASETGLPFLGDTRSALSTPGVDAVYVSNLNCDHASTVELALSANKHVLCEKPLALTKAEAIRLFEFAENRQTPHPPGRFFLPPL